jgi:hypothetical protein
MNHNSVAGFALCRCLLTESVCKYVGVGKVTVADLSLILYRFESESDFGRESKFFTDDRSTDAS